MTKEKVLGAHGAAGRLGAFRLHSPNAFLHAVRSKLNCSSSSTRSYLYQKDSSKDCELHLERRFGTARAKGEPYQGGELVMSLSKYTREKWEEATMSRNGQGAQSTKQMDSYAWLEERGIDHLAHQFFFSKQVRGRSNSSWIIVDIIMDFVMVGSTYLDCAP